MVEAAFNEGSPVSSLTERYLWSVATGQPGERPAARSDHGRSIRPFENAELKISDKDVITTIVFIEKQGDDRYRRDDTNKPV